MAKVLTIIENDPILGVKYGLVEIPDVEIPDNEIQLPDQKKYAAAAYNAAQARLQSIKATKIRANHTQSK
ncbi:MAG: hypothetical protein E7011_01180 [Alphaproteobacteria bacterium]|nr:hypothetical protein [Alphaproteobacteria bacterium]